MAAVALILGFLMISQVDAIEEYGRHSNGVAEYSFVTPVDCNTGLRDTGFALALGRTVVLKQHNTDGSVGEVCAE